LFKWSTTVAWAQVPQKYSDAMLNTQVLIQDLQHLKPKVVIVAVSIDKLIHILPGMIFLYLL